MTWDIIFYLATTMIIVHYGIELLFYYKDKIKNPTYIDSKLNVRELLPTFFMGYLLMFITFGMGQLYHNVYMYILH